MILYKLKVSKNFFDSQRIQSINLIKKMLDFYKYTCMAEVEEMVVGDKVVIFPISSCYYTDEVKRYLDLRFKPYFVRMTDFRKIKKEMYNRQSIEVKETKEE